MGKVQAEFGERTGKRIWQGSGKGSGQGLGKVQGGLREGLIGRFRLGSDRVCGKVQEKVQGNVCARFGQGLG